ncbi:MAG: hypothetical protein MR968_00910 [Prevotella sp.]|nr:hypothetical protein [Prevotella sp.]
MGGNTGRRTLLRAAAAGCQSAVRGAQGLSEGCSAARALPHGGRATAGAAGSNDRRTHRQPSGATGRPHDLPTAPARG